MKKVLISILLLAFVQTSYAGHHEQGGALALEKRQADSEMTMTSLTLGDTETVINAKGTMGEYGLSMLPTNLVTTLTESVAL